MWVISEQRVFIVKTIRDQSCNHANHNASEANCDTENMLIECNWSAVECLSSELYENVLNSNADDHDSSEVRVSEQFWEGINCGMAEVTAIEFVEELK